MAFAPHFYYHLSFSTQQALISQVENTRVFHRAYKLQIFLTINNVVKLMLRSDNMM